jgi:metal-responsive CopG/Arc/MetJ family transcriptional regulator
MAVKTAISIPDPLFKEAERLTRRLRIPRSQLYARALEAYLQRQRSKGIKEALDEVYGTESSELDPDLAAAAYHILAKEKW